MALEPVKTFCQSHFIMYFGIENEIVRKFLIFVSFFYFRQAHTILVLFLFSLVLVYVTIFEEVVKDSDYNMKRYNLPLGSTSHNLFFLSKTLQRKFFLVTNLNMKYLKIDTSCKLSFEEHLWNDLVSLSVHETIYIPIKFFDGFR